MLAVVGKVRRVSQILRLGNHQAVHPARTSLLHSFVVDSEIAPKSSGPATIEVSVVFQTVAQAGIWDFDLVSHARVQQRQLLKKSCQ